MLEYWRLHDRRFGDIDYSRDPEGLVNVCAAGQPLWLGRYYARFQQIVYERLLRPLRDPESGMRALDVGCGAARWCTLLAERGYDVTGIDIQPTLIAENRRRFPDMAFFDVPVQEFTDEERFHLVSCVTVLQHLPFEEQPRTVARLRDLTVPGGHAVVLENVRHQSPDHFSRDIAGWKSMFENAGFRTLALEAYNYSLALRAAGRVRSLFPASGGGDTGSRVESVVAARPDRERESGVRGLLRSGHRALLRGAVALDTRLEPLLVARRTPFAPTNCGFLFQAV
jgi:SAM-dependent methyltransferase